MPLKGELMTYLDNVMTGAQYKANIKGHCIVNKHMNAIMTLYRLFIAKYNLYIAKSSIGNQRPQESQEYEPSYLSVSVHSCLLCSDAEAE